MKIILISIHSLALNYLKDSFTEDQLKIVTLVTDKTTRELKSFLKNKNVKYLAVKNITNSSLKKLDLQKDDIVISAGSPWIFKENLINKLGKNFFNIHQSPCLA